MNKTFFDFSNKMFQSHTKGEKEMKGLLIGNTFPQTLVRRSVKTTPISLEEAREIIKNAGAWVSFWGHQNTSNVASSVLGVDITPKTERPAVKLTAENYPILDGVVAKQVLLLSPEYPAGFRPQIGQEVPDEMVLGWQALLMEW